MTAEYNLITKNGRKVVTPEEVINPNELLGGTNAKDNAKILLSILSGEATSTKKTVVIINAAYAIITYDPKKTLAEAIQMAEESLQSKKALNALESLRSL